MGIDSLISGLALGVSAIASWFAIHSWREATRPVVVAAVRTNVGGNVSITYDVVVSNTGTRPAVDVVLQPDMPALDAAFGAGAAHQRPIIMRCFDESHRIPLLVNGESLTNSFGLTTGDDTTSVWKYGSRIPVAIIYKDLEGRVYKSSVTLAIRDSSGFAGGSWQKAR